MCPIQCKVTPGSEAWRKNILVYTTMHAKMNESRCIPGKLISQILKKIEKIFFYRFFRAIADRGDLLPGAQMDPIGVPFASAVRIWNAAAARLESLIVPAHPVWSLYYYYPTGCVCRGRGSTEIRLFSQALYGGRGVLRCRASRGRGSTEIRSLLLRIKGVYGAPEATS